MYAPDLLDFVYITDGASTAEDVKACELKILSALNFNVTRPHSLHFLRRNSKAGDANQEQHNLAKFLMECTIGEYELAHQPPSLVASASLLLALKLTNSPEVIADNSTDLFWCVQFYLRRPFLSCGATTWCFTPPTPALTW